MPSPKEIDRLRQVVAGAKKIMNNAVGHRSASQAVKDRAKAEYDKAVKALGDAVRRG